MKTSLSLPFLLLAATAVSSVAQTNFSLTPLASFGSTFGRTDGSIRPGDAPYVTAPPTGANQRGMAYDPTTGALVLVDTHSGSGGSTVVQGGIYILDGTTGTNISTLLTNGINGGSYADASTGVADDGVVYVANQVTVSTLPVTIYRWDSVGSANPPVVAFSSVIAPTQRYGTSMDVRGAGTNTQIILGSSSLSGASGTNFLLLRTVDGTNFTAIVVGTDVTTPGFNDGIAFGISNTIWAKNLGFPLRLLSFNPATSNAVTLKSYDVNAVINGDLLGPIAVDNSNKLLAAVEVNSGTVGPERVRLYDISDTNRPPQLLDVEAFPVNNNNATAPPAHLDFGGGRLYAHVLLNGLMAFSLDQVPTPPPTIASAPAATNRVVVGRTISLIVSAFPFVTYQWQFYGTNLPNQTNAILSLVNVQTNQSGPYKCIVTNPGGTTNAATELVVVSSSLFYHLNLQWSVAPGTQPYLNNNGVSGVPNQRTVAYNAASNHLYVISRSSNTTSNYVIYVVDANNGAVLYTLKTNGITCGVGQGGIGLVGMRVAEDGSIYACNMAVNAFGDASTSPDPAKFFRIYRWANGDSNTLPVQVYQSDPTFLAGETSTPLRWGDVMNIRGGGANTQILLDSQNAAGSTMWTAVLTPADGTFANWNQTVFGREAVATTIGRSLEFGETNTYWQRRKGASLVFSSFDTNSPGSLQTTLASFTSFTNTLCGTAIDPTTSRHLLVGVNVPAAGTFPDTLDLYEISDLTAPLLLAQYNFPANSGTNHNPNGNFITDNVFSGDKLFTIDAQNGIMAFKIAAGPPTAPSFLSQPSNIRVIRGGSGGFSVAVDQQSTFQWQFNGANIAGATSASYVVTNAQTTNAGGYRVIATNFFGAATSAVATLTVSLPQDNYSLSPIWSLAPTTRPYLPTDSDSQGQTPLYRCLAYNSLSNQIYIVSRTGASSGLTVNVLDAATGADLYQLDTTGISGGNIVLLGIGAAADGAIYAANLDSTSGSLTNPPAVYKLYRWADSGPATQPMLVYTGEPADQAVPVRWGDTMDVRGSGINTEVVIDSNQGLYTAVLTPVDGSMSAFTNSAFAEAGVASPIGRSLQFGPTNTIWQKRSGAALRLTGYDLTAHSSVALSNINTFPASLGPVGLDLSRNLLAGINFSGSGVPDTLGLYEISDFSTPMLIASYNFPTNHQPNANLIGQVVFAGNHVWGLDGNNGIVAFSINGPSLKITPVGSGVVVSWPLFPGFTLQASPSILPPVTWTNVGPGTIVGGQYVRTNAAPTGTLFYRLAK